MRDEPRWSRPTRYRHGEGRVAPAIEKCTRVRVCVNASVSSGAGSPNEVDGNATPLSIANALGIGEHVRVEGNSHGQL